jgi:hypothetical protein
MKAIMRRLEDSIVSGAELSAIFVWVKRKWDAGSSLEVMSGAGATAAFQQTQTRGVSTDSGNRHFAPALVCAKISSQMVLFAPPVI